MLPGDAAPARRAMPIRARPGRDLPVQPRAAVDYLAWRRTRVGADLFSWIRTNVPQRSPLERRLPWLNFALIRELDHWLRAGPRTVFEWGAGGSTVFFADRATTVVTVEHDAAWVAEVTRWLARYRITNVDLRHVPEATGTMSEAVRAEPPLRQEKLAQFCGYINEVHADGTTYDLIQVDARARLECVAAARDRLTPDGVLVIDDVDKPGRFDDLLRLLPSDAWQVRRTWGPGPSSGLRVVTAAAVCRRR